MFEKDGVLAAKRGCFGHSCVQKTSEPLKARDELLLPEAHLFFGQIMRLVRLFWFVPVAYRKNPLSQKAFLLLLTIPFSLSFQVYPEFCQRPCKWYQWPQQILWGGSQPEEVPSC